MPSCPSAYARSSRRTPSAWGSTSPTCVSSSITPCPARWRRTIRKRDAQAATGSRPKCICCTRSPTASRTSSSSRARIRSAHWSRKSMTAYARSLIARGRFRWSLAPSRLRCPARSATARWSRRCACSSRQGRCARIRRPAVACSFGSSPRRSASSVKWAAIARSSWASCAHSGASGATRCTTACRWISTDCRRDSVARLGRCRCSRSSSADSSSSGIVSVAATTSPILVVRSPRIHSTGRRSTGDARTSCRSSTRCSSTPTPPGAGAASCFATSAIPRPERTAADATSGSARTTRLVGRRPPRLPSPARNGARVAIAAPRSQSHRSSSRVRRTRACSSGCARSARASRARSRCRRTSSSPIGRSSRSPFDARSRRSHSERSAAWVP